MEFKARLAGADIKSSNKNAKQQPDDEDSEIRTPKKKSGMIDRLRQKKQESLESSASSGDNATFSDGVGYKVI